MYRSNGGVTQLRVLLGKSGITRLLKFHTSGLISFFIPRNGKVIHILGIILLYKGVSYSCLDQILTIIDDRKTIFLIDCWLSRNPNINNVTINHLEY